MISLIFFILASICNAVQDTCAHHYSTSIFKKLNPEYWNSDLSWKRKYINSDPVNGMRKIFFGALDYPVFLTDAWHLFKSLCIIFICISIATFKGYTIYCLDPEWMNIIIAIVFYGAIWNIVFSLFYNRILKKK